MTNDRRKTFNTPLEFVRWASEFPGQRKASSPNTGAPFYFFVSSVDACIAYGEGSNRRITTEISPIHFPLTAVEDEHGVIPETEPTQDYISNIEAAVDIIRTPATGGDSKGVREAYISTSTGLLVDAIRQIADERIAAATVVVRDECGGGWKGGWSDTGYRLKPKGE